MCLFLFETAEQFNTIEVLKRLRVEFPDIPMTLIWDGAPYHPAQRVTASAEVLEIQLQLLPGYSPDFMPVEHLRQWLREDVTCYTSKADLIGQVKFVEQQIKAQPISLADRLWVKNHLNSEEEKLRLSC